MKGVQQGFTLIGLMLVVAIVGVLAAIALPAYQDEVIRSQMSEAEAAVAACKASVAEYTASHGTLPADSATAECSTAPSQYVLPAAARFNGTSVTYIASIRHAGSSILCALILTPSAPTTDGIISAWRGTFGVGTGCASKYIPSSLRG